MQYVYSGSPQIRSGVTTRKILMHVCIALLPSCIAGCIFFGWGALLTLAIAVFAAVASEVVCTDCAAEYRSKRYLRNLILLRL